MEPVQEEYGERFIWVNSWSWQRLAADSPSGTTPTWPCVTIANVQRLRSDLMLVPCQTSISLFTARCIAEVNGQSAAEAEGWLRRKFVWCWSRGGVGRGSAWALWGRKRGSHVLSLVRTKRPSCPLSLLAFQQSASLKIEEYQRRPYCCAAVFV